jgi:hypothetical protein
MEFEIICLSISLELLFHIESSTTLDEVWTTLEVLFGKQNDLEDCIPENTKKNPEEKPSEDLGKGHALTFISSSPNTWISDLGNKLLDPSTNRLFIEGSEKFDEGPLHAFQEKPATAFPPLPKANLREDSSCYMDQISDQISKYDLDVHEHAIIDQFPELKIVFFHIYAP